MFAVREMPECGKLDGQRGMIKKHLEMEMKLRNIFRKYSYSLGQAAQKADPLDSVHMTDTGIDL